MMLLQEAIWLLMGCIPVYKSDALHHNQGIEAPIQHDNIGWHLGIEVKVNKMAIGSAGQGKMSDW